MRGKFARALQRQCVNRIAGSHVPLWAFAFLLLALVTGCRVVQTAVDVPVRAVTPGKKGKHAADPVEAQQTLFRLTDEFSTRMIIGIEKLRRGTNLIDPAQ